MDEIRTDGPDLFSASKKTKFVLSVSSPLPPRYSPFLPSPSSPSSSPHHSVFPIVVSCHPPPPLVSVIKKNDCSTKTMTMTLSPHRPLSAPSPPPPTPPSPPPPSVHHRQPDTNTTATAPPLLVITSIEDRRDSSQPRQLLVCALATPKQIKDLMQVEGLTNDKVKSHLQKYRLHVRKVPSSSPTSSNEISMGQVLQLDISSKAGTSFSDSPDGLLPLTMRSNNHNSSAASSESSMEEDQRLDSRR